MMTESDSIQVLLVDDHTIVRQGLKQLLELDEGIHILDEAGNGEEAILKAITQKPDVTLMDINLPKANGFEASRAILTAWPDAKIIILTNQDDPQIISKLMDLGVKGFLLKDVQVDSLIESIRKVHQGGQVELAQELAEKLKTHQAQSVRESHYFALTEREKEVLLALTKGYSNQQLADLLTVSPKTVHNHLYNIYSKIGVNTRAEAIVWALESGFLEK